MHYVIGDVHGCYDEMIALLQKIEERDSEAIIYFVGDFIDRGPKVWEVLEWAMELFDYEQVAKWIANIRLTAKK